MQRLLYVSESQIELPDVPSAVDHIVAGAQIRNAQLDITGALLFTEINFAQVLEGPSASIDTLMMSLRNDPRHRNIIVVEQSQIAQRKFPEWKMAYHGPSQFVSRHVSRLLHQTSQSERRRATAWLTALALEFSTTH